MSCCNEFIPPLRPPAPIDSPHRQTAQAIFQVHWAKTRDEWGRATYLAVMRKWQEREGPGGWGKRGATRESEGLENLLKVVVAMMVWVSAF
jgi:hypothetical protein